MIHSRSVYTVLFVGLVLSLTTAGWIHQLENERIEAQFIATAKEKINNVNRQIIEGFSVLDYVRFVVEEADDSSNDSINRIFERIHTQSPLLEGIAWARLENRDNQLSLPISMVEPRQRYADWLGSDLAQIPDFLETARPVLTGAQLTQVVSVQDRQGNENQLTLSRTHSIKQGTLGLIIASLNIPALLEDAIGQVELTGSSIEITLESVNLGQRSFRWPADEQPLYASRLIFQTTLENPANIVLRVRVLPLQRFYDERQSSSAWLVAACGVTLTLLVAMYLGSQVQLRRELEKLSVTDALTNIANRRHFDQTLAREWQSARRSQQPLSLLLIDIDYFKRYNDHYGHDAGDACLSAVAKVLSGVISRPRDLLARLGGEEFVVILPETDHGAEELAERCRQAIEQAAIPHAAAEGRGYLSLSIGWASLRVKAHQSSDLLLRMADEALYQAKDQGRNCVRGYTGVEQRAAKPVPPGSSDNSHS